MIAFVNEDALSLVYVHCARATFGTTREEAALLYGYPCVDRAANAFTWVTAAVPAITEATATRVVIKEESFIADRSPIDHGAVLGRSPVLVGWAHSHPFGGSSAIFMSGTDVDTMRTLFPRAHQLAIVLDPKSGHWDCFGWVCGYVAPVTVRVVRDPHWRACFTGPWATP